MNKDKDLTRGNPFSLIFSFAFSMMMGNIFQQLYTVVDWFIIGRKIGPLGHAAMGGTDWLIFLYGHEYLLVLGIFFPLLYMLYIMRATLQGLGNTVVPMISSFGQLIMRVFCALVMTMIVGYSGIFYGEISAWILADLILIVTYFKEIRRAGNAFGNVN